MQKSFRGRAEEVSASSHSGARYSCSSQSITTVAMGNVPKSSPLGSPLSRSMPVDKRTVTEPYSTSSACTQSSYIPREQSLGPSTHALQLVKPSPSSTASLQAACLWYCTLMWEFHSEGSEPTSNGTHFWFCSVFMKVDDSQISRNSPDSSIRVRRAKYRAPNPDPQIHFCVQDRIT